MVECQNVLRGRLTLNKGDKHYIARDLAAKLGKLWKMVNQWKMVPLGRGYYDFLFEQADDLRRVWAAGNIALNPGLLHLSQWTKNFNHYSQKQTHSSIWIRLVELPQEYWREQTLKEIASAVGTPIDLDAPTRNRTFGHYARILVDIDLSKRAYDEILVEHEGFAFKIEVQYEKRPLFFHHCYVIGHNVSTCKWLHLEATKVTDHGKKPMAAEPLAKKNPPRQHRSDRGVSNSGTMQYVVVAAPSTSATIIYTQEWSTTKNIVPPKDVSSSCFSFSLQLKTLLLRACYLSQLSPFWNWLPMLLTMTCTLLKRRERGKNLEGLIPIVVALLLTYVEHVDVHENFDGTNLDSVREVSSSPVLNIVVHEEVIASSKDMPSVTFVHPHHTAVYTVPTTPIDGLVTPSYAINSIPYPIPAAPAFVADSVPVDSSIGTQILLTADAVPTATTIVSSSPIASSLATQKVGIVYHSNPRFNMIWSFGSESKTMTRGPLKLLSLLSCQKSKNKI